jgi:hypothetical protein
VRVSGKTKQSKSVASSDWLGLGLRFVCSLVRFFVRSFVRSFVRCVCVQDNNFAHIDSIKSTGLFYGPQNPDVKYTPISVQDVGRTAAAILSDAHPEHHHGKTYDLVMPAITMNELASHFSAALGKEVKYVQVSLSPLKFESQTQRSRSWVLVLLALSMFLLISVIVVVVGGGGGGHGFGPFFFPVLF